MKRREFLNTCGAGLALAMAPGATLAATAQQSWAAAYRESLATQPWLAGYKSVEADSYAAQAQISGKWPGALSGTLYRNGPAQHEVGGFRYHHWFDGDGMLQAFRLTPGGVSHQAKMIQTRKYQAEKAAGRALYPGFGSIPPNPGPVTSADVINVANISVLPHHGKLLALWEAGSPWEMDPDTLETRGIYSFSEATRGVPFSAHPRVEADGSLWNFGYVSSSKLLVFWHIDRSGKLRNIGKIASDPISMPHDFIVTSRHIVMLMPPLNYEPSVGSSFLDAHVWHPEQSTRVLVVDKNDFSKYRWLELPSQWVFHFGNGWEDEAGVIRFDGARAADPSLMQDSFRDIMRGETTPGAGTHHYQYRIDTRNWTVTESPLMATNIQTEFPAIDPRVSARAYRRLVMLCRDLDSPAAHGGLNEVCSFDLDSGLRQAWRYPDTQLPEEHLFVAAPGSAPETRGWVLGTAHDWQQQSTLLNVFDIDAVDAGPIATAALPYALPLGLHGKYVAS